MRLRVLPLTITAAFLVLGLKTGEVMRDGQTVALSFAGEARAQAPKPATLPVTPVTAPSTDAAAVPKVTPPSTVAAPGEDDAHKREFSQVEIDLLQSLAKRRQELDDWAKQIQLKENMLIATEQRMNDKIATLQRMKKELETLLAQYNAQEDTKIRSLVRIYENMKPAQAARIFEELDMPVLLTVVDRMSERKVAPILAGMSPEKAKDLTVQLAEQRKLQKVRPAPAPIAGPPPAGADTGTPSPTAALGPQPPDTPTSGTPAAAGGPSAPSGGGG